MHTSKLNNKHISNVGLITQTYSTKWNDENVGGGIVVNSADAYSTLFVWTLHIHVYVCVFMSKCARDNKRKCCQTIRQTDRQRNKDLYKSSDKLHTKRDGKKTQKKNLENLSIKNTSTCNKCVINNK